MLIYSHNFKQYVFDIWAYKTLLDLTFHCLLALKYRMSQNKFYIILNLYKLTLRRAI